MTQWNKERSLLLARDYKVRGSNDLKPCSSATGVEAVNSEPIYNPFVEYQAPQHTVLNYSGLICGQDMVLMVLFKCRV